MSFKNNKRMKPSDEGEMASVSSPFMGKFSDPIYKPIRENSLSLTFNVNSLESITTIPKILITQLTYSALFDSDNIPVLKPYFYKLKSGNNVPPANIQDDSIFTGFSITITKHEIKNHMALADIVEVKNTGPQERSNFLQEGKTLVITKPKSKPPVMYINKEGKDGNIFLELDTRFLKPTLKHGTKKYFQPLTYNNNASIDTTENICFVDVGHKKWGKKLITESSVNKIDDINQQVFPHYIGANIYSHGMDADDRVIISEGIVAKTAGTFGKFSKTNALVDTYLSNYVEYQHQNYVKENLKNHLIEPGETFQLEKLPPTGVIALTGGNEIEIALQCPGNLINAKFQLDKLSTAYPCSYMKGIDQLYDNENSIHTSLSRIGQIENCGSGHNLLYTVPIPKATSGYLKVRSMVLFQSSFTITFYTREDQSVATLDEVTYTEENKTKYNEELADSVQKIPPTKKPGKKVNLPFYIINKDEKQCIFP